MAKQRREHSSSIVNIFNVVPLSVRSKIKSQVHTWLRWCAYKRRFGNIMLTANRADRFIGFGLPYNTDVSSLLCCFCFMSLPLID